MLQGPSRIVHVMLRRHHVAVALLAASLVACAHTSTSSDAFSLLPISNAASPRAEPPLGDLPAPTISAAVKSTGAIAAVADIDTVDVACPGEQHNTVNSYFSSLVNSGYLIYDVKPGALVTIGAKPSAQAAVVSIALPGGVTGRTCVDWYTVKQEL
jgi:hypothetical protein